MIKLKTENNMITGQAIGDEDTLDRLICTFFEKRAKEMNVSLAEYMGRNIREVMNVEKQDPNNISFAYSFNNDVDSLICLDENNIEIKGKDVDKMMSILCQIRAKSLNMNFDDYILSVSAFAFGIC